jgi:hypothetical protein
MKKVLIALILGLVLVGMLATPGFAKKTPPPTPVEHGIITGLCMFYYGTWSDSTYNRILAAKPEFVVLNTASGPYTTDNTYLDAAKVAGLKLVGIKVLSYIPIGMMCGWVYPEPDAPLQNDGGDKVRVLKFVDDIANIDLCDGVFFDEASVGYWRTTTGEHNDADYPAPQYIVQQDEKGNWYYPETEEEIANAIQNDWYSDLLSDSLYEGTSDDVEDINTLQELCNYARNTAGLEYTVAGVDSTNLIANMFDAFNYVLSDEGYTNRDPQGGELVHPNQCWVISGGVKSASRAAVYTETALNKGFGGAYHCQSYGTLASWFDDYINLLAEYQSN